MSPPNTFCLSNAEYIEEKKRVSVEFSNLTEIKNISFPFVPFILIHNSCVDGSFLDFLNSSKKLKIEKISNGLKIFSSDFSFLKCINSMIHNKGILLSPERQFLLLNNWSFFDAFELEEKMTKRELIDFPELNLNFSSSSLKDEVSEMLVFSKKSGKTFLNKLVLSNILCLKLVSLPGSKSKLIDFFIESVLFKNNFAFNKNIPKFDSGFVEKINSGKLKEVDFSFVWPVLFSFPFYNIGFDSVNCSCCKPDKLSESNILPSSLIEVKFLEEAVYFQSSNQDWTEFFHSNALGKEKRIKRMNEWKLNSVPAGPFFRNDVLRVPLIDALKLSSENKAVFFKDHYLIWSCRKKECFFSKELNELNKKIVFFDEKINELEKNLIKENGIAFSLYADENPEFNFFSEYKNTLKILFSSVPFQLSSVSSVFFDVSFSNSIKCVFSSVLTKFKEFSINNSSNSFVTKNSVLVDSDNALDLLTEFSKKERIPVPELKV